MLFDRWFKICILSTTSLAFVISSTVLHANPQGGRVKAGAATIHHDKNYTHIQQSSKQAIIDWKTFNIAKKEHTHFQLPSNKSATLNRIDGKHGASNIFGRLSSNGNLFLINPAGMLFGRSAKVDVAGLMATTADIRNDDFMNSRYHFQQSPGSPQGQVTNYGHIRIKDEGLAALVAPGVENYGVIEARLGKVALASGNAFTLDLYGDDLIHFSVNGDIEQDASIANSVRNSGSIIADGGSVQLTAQSASSVVKSVINTDGYIQADTVEQIGGTIILGSSNGSANVAGTLRAKGIEKGDKGGKIKVLANNIDIKAASTIDASGHSGGGEVLIGGNYQGKGPEENANTTSIGPETVIAANANEQGDGGRVIVWADDTTTFDGTIEAKAGINGGDGGFVETSGKKSLAVNGVVNASANHGQPGIWLLDPTNFTVSDGLAASFSATLDAGTSVTIKTSATGADDGDITFDNTTTPLSWSEHADFNAYAINDIVFSPDATITTSGNGDITLRADSDADGVGTVTLTDDNQVLTAGTGRIELFYNPSSYPTAYDYSDNVSADNGTFKAYMLVNSGYDLQHITDNMAGTYALGTDLNLENYEFDIDSNEDPVTDAAPYFVPIGKTIPYDSTSSPYPWEYKENGDIYFTTAQFTGEINGDGRTISNLDISGVRYEGQQNSGTLQAYQGLIWRSKSTSIYDLNLENFTVVTGGTSSMAGTLIADIRGSASIDNVHIIGGTVLGYTNAGGLAGRLYGAYDLDKVTISNVSNSAAVTATSTAVGGIIGQLVGDDDYNNFGLTTELTNVINMGPVKTGTSHVGGIIGFASKSGTLSLDGVINTGDITSTAGTSNYNGGLIGVVNDNNNLNDYAGHSTITIDNSYNTGTVTGDKNTAGIIGSMTNGNFVTTLTNVYNTGAIDGGNFTGGIIGNYANTSNSPTLNMTRVYNTGALTSGMTGGGLMSNYLVDKTGTYTSNSSNYGLAINDAYSNATIDSTGSSDYVGGLIGDVITDVTLDFDGNNAYFYEASWDSNTVAACGSKASSRCTSTNTALTSDNLTTQTSYDGFEFTTDPTWSIIGDVSYPYVLATTEKLSGTLTDSNGSALPADTIIAQQNQAHVVQTDLDGTPIATSAKTQDIYGTGNTGDYTGGILISSTASDMGIPALLDFTDGTAGNIVYLSSDDTTDSVTTGVNGQTGDVTLYAAATDSTGEFSMAGITTMLDNSGSPTNLMFDVYDSTSEKNYQNYIKADSTSYTVTGPEQDLQWVLTNSADAISDNLYGMSNILRFDNFDTYTSGSGKNYFQYNSQSSTPAIVGGSGTNTLAGSDNDNSWSMQTTQYNGSNSDVASFTNIQQLIGGTEVDSFSLASGFMDVVHGGTGTNNNSLSQTDDTALTWTITGENMGTMGAVEFNNISNLAGSSVVDTFIVTGDDSSITTLEGGSSNDIFTVSDGGTVTTINGEAGDDTFYLGGSDLVTTITGGDGIDTITRIDSNDSDWILSEAYAGTMDATTGFSEIEEIEAYNGANNSLTGINSGNIFSITGTDSGSITNTSTSPATQLDSFSNINTLRGADGDDTFNVGVDGYLITANGHAGDDTFTISAGGTIAAIYAGTGDDTFTITGDGSTVTTLDADAGTDIISISDGGAVTTINAGDDNDSITIDTTGTATTINGDDGNDTFSLGGSDLVTTIAGGDGIDTITRTDSNDSDWILSEAYAGTMDATTGFSEIEEIEAYNGANNSLTGINGGNIFSITGTDSGSITNTSTSPATQLDSFSNINTLRGADGDDTFNVGVDGYLITANGHAGDDTFTISAGGTIAAIYAGTGDDTFTITGDGSTVTTLDADAGTDIISISDGGAVTTINAGDDNDSITIDTTGTATTINGDDGNDTFSLGGSDLVTTIAGGDGIDTITRTDSNDSDWILSEAYAGTMDATTGFSEIEVIAAGTGDNTLTGTNSTDGFVVTGDNAGSVKDSISSFSNIGVLNGADGNDAFTIEDDSSLTIISTGGAGYIDGNGGKNSLAQPSDYHTLTTQGDNGELYDNAFNLILNYYNIQDFLNTTSLYIEGIYIPSILNGIQQQTETSSDSLNIYEYDEELQRCAAGNECEEDTLITFQVQRQRD